MPEQLPCTLISWETMYDLCRRLAIKLRAAHFRIDMLVAIGRGGCIPGRILSDMLGIDNLTSFKIEHYHGPNEQHEAFVRYPLAAEVDNLNILLLDDVSDSGDTFYVGLEHIRQRGQVNDIRTAALHYKTVSKFIPDFFVETVSEWRWLIYPWAVNEDLSTMIAKMRLNSADVQRVRQRIKQLHGIEVTVRQVEDALQLLGPR
ncbi:MAG: phosphoribosyltransferase [Gammaproteobacteria bacterium]